MELEVRELLKAYDFPGDDLPVIRGSAVKALNGEAGADAPILELFDALDNYIPHAGARRSTSRS